VMIEKVKVAERERGWNEREKELSTKDSTS
jgi:hypothetical protein